MTKEKKNEFTLRISQANRSELIIILYEMTICYIEDVINISHTSDTGVANNIELQNAVRRAVGCIEEMQNNLHYEYDLAKNLKQIYLYMKKQLRIAGTTGNTDSLYVVKKELEILRDAYKTIKDTDTSRPVMVNTQLVLTGMTYDRNRILDSLTTEYSSRGYRV